jgi:hypothetical protein
VKNLISRFRGSRSTVLAACLVALALVACGPSSVFAQVALPATGVDLEEWIPVLITAFGGIVALIVGGAFAFMLVWKGISKARRALG